MNDAERDHLETKYRLREREREITALRDAMAKVVSAWADQTAKLDHLTGWAARLVKERQALIAQRDTLAKFVGGNSANCTPPVV